METQELTREKAETLHRELWQWLADNPTAGKEDHPKMEEWRDRYNLTDDCLPCAIARRERPHVGPQSTACRCDYCPIDLHTEDIGCSVRGCYPDYQSWDTCHNHTRERTRIALRIRDWPWSKI